MMKPPPNRALERDLIRIAFNGSALLSPLTGVGQYAKSLAEQLVTDENLDLHFFYAAIWSRDIRTGPVKKSARSRN